MAERIEPAGSVGQIGWVELAQMIRVGIGLKAREIPCMPADQINHLVLAAQTAYWLEHNAWLFDHNLDTEEAKGPYS